MNRRVNVDADIGEADWIKQSWPRDLPRTAAGLRRTIKGMGMTVTQFKKLPLYRRNVRRLAFLREL